MAEGIEPWSVAWETQVQIPTAAPASILQQDVYSTLLRLFGSGRKIQEVPCTNSIRHVKDPPLPLSQRVAEVRRGM